MTANIYRHEPLTLSEYNRLGQLKKGLGKLLNTIREEEIASVVTFSLADMAKPANEAQLLEAAKPATQEESAAREESCSPDDSSIISSSATFVNCRIQEGSPIKQESGFKKTPATFI